jgi:hypothetical protein
MIVPAVVQVRAAAVRCCKLGSIMLGLQLLEAGSLHKGSQIVNQIAARPFLDHARDSSFSDSPDDHGGSRPAPTWSLHGLRDYAYQA